MPLLIYSIIRIYRAVVSTAVLVTDVEVMRRLPWGHIRRLPREDKWVGLAVFCLGFSTIILPFGALSPGLFNFAALIAAVGLFASWLRPIAQRRRAAATDT